MRAKSLAIAAVLCGILTGARRADAVEEQVFQIYPIGTVEREGDKTYLVIRGRYAKGLTGLEGYSHVQVIYWLDKNDTPQKRSILQVRPRGDPRNPVTGVFACRAPVRPNLIGLSTCKILDVAGSRVQVEEISAFDHTPIVDLKPFIPTDAPTQGVRVPAWAAAKPQENREAAGKGKE